MPDAGMTASHLKSNTDTAETICGKLQKHANLRNKYANRVQHKDGSILPCPVFEEKRDFV